MKKIIMVCLAVIILAAAAAYAAAESTPAGTYYLEYEVDDMFMNPHVLERIEYTWDGEKVILPEGFAWEGSVSVK